MHRHAMFSPLGLNRRKMLAGAGAFAGTLGLSSRLGRVGAQAATPDAMAHHPIVGAWNAMTPGGPSLAVFAADGTATFANPTTIGGTTHVPLAALGPAGDVVYLTASVGTWEPTGPRSIHFTATLVITDGNGVHLGYQTNDAYPVVSADGQSLRDDQSQGKVTMRNAAGATVQELATAGAPPVTGLRMGVGAPGFPDGTHATGTPTG
jgi:hypothetical protein